MLASVLPVLPIEKLFEELCGHISSTTRSSNPSGHVTGRTTQVTLASNRERIDHATFIWSDLISRFFRISWQLFLICHCLRLCYWLVFFLLNCWATSPGSSGNVSYQANRCPCPGNYKKCHLPPFYGPHGPHGPYDMDIYTVGIKSFRSRTIWILYWYIPNNFWKSHYTRANTFSIDVMSCMFSCLISIHIGLVIRCCGSRL